MAGGAVMKSVVAGRLTTPSSNIDPSSRHITP
jgi:hypothetical protein